MFELIFGELSTSKLGRKFCNAIDYWDTLRGEKRNPVRQRNTCFSCRNPASNNDNSLESLLDEESSKCASMTTSNTENSISTLNSADYLMDEDDMDQTTTPTPEQINNQESKAKKTNFGTLQMKVQEIRAQLDVLSDKRTTRHPPPTTLPPPPPLPDPRAGKIQHPNTPAQGYEHMLPPNLVNNEDKNDNVASYLSSALFHSKNDSSEVFFPLFPTTTYSDIFNTQPATNPHKEQLLQLQQSLLQRSNAGHDTAESSASPVSSSSPSHNNRGSTFVAVPFRLPLSVAAHIGNNGGSLSTSPSTLSPCSSNSLPSSSNLPHSSSSQQLYQFPQANQRPSRLPMSHSVHAFGHQQSQAENMDKLFFFFDVIMTQEKIAKVKRGIIGDNSGSCGI